MNFAGSGSQKGFQVEAPGFRMRSSGGFGAAADMTDTAGIFQANRARAPKYDQQSATDMATRAAERNAITKAEAQTHAQGLQSIASVRSAKMIADAQVAAAEKQASAAKSGAMMSGIGSIAGAALGLLSDETTKTNIERIDDALTTSVSCVQSPFITLKSSAQALSVCTTASSHRTMRRLCPTQLITMRV